MRRDVMRRLLVFVLVTFGPAALAERDPCPRPDKRASPEEVFAARLEAMQRGDLDAIACSYDEDAVVVFPGAVLRGRAEIMRAFVEFAGVLGNAPPIITSVTAADALLLVTYEVHTPLISIPDGADTFVIRKGRIQYQVVHATLVFNQP